MNKWINESMNQWINESMNQWINESMNQWTESIWINELLNDRGKNSLLWISIQRNIGET